MILSKLRIPETMIRWLDHVPIAVMGALLAQERCYRMDVDPGAFTRIDCDRAAFLTAFLTKPVCHRHCRDPDFGGAPLVF